MSSESLSSSGHREVESNPREESLRANTSTHAKHFSEARGKGILRLDLSDKRRSLERKTGRMRVITWVAELVWYTASAL